MLRLLFAATLAALPIWMAGPGLAQEQSRPSLSDMSDGQRALLRQEIRAYLLENPEVIFEAIEIFEQRRNAASVEADRRLLVTNEQAIYNDGHSWVGGNPDGDITLVEFSDYRCGYCKQAHPELQALLDSDENIRLIVKEFPILGPESTAAGRMALAAFDLNPDLYEALNDSLMDFPQNLTEAFAYRIAGDVGYDTDALRERADSDEITQKLEKNYQLAQALGLQGTPSFILGDEIIRGYLPLQDMQAVVAEVRARARAEAN